ncbi:TIR domain-containing protein [Actinokineospora auranticolor]|uniref:TIR domain-containing protein n=1 Tax=Actinokineospora auranticolor TaxID=155976 RepID=A0A2S6GN09_9PSEU|nr:TIR domain-containing protein [Actinokineospora auranticolor]PPK66629.1 TIR domain-containing protein [Actinokineospora auranticolor]
MERVAAAEFQDVAVVSCDIIGHSAANEAEQVRRVAAINDIVAAAIRRDARHIVWSSGGDGGHVVFFGDEWQADAVRLVADLSGWARDERLTLRVTGHVGRVATLVGADGRVQAVGTGINFAGWLIRQATGHGILVSDRFRQEVAAAPSTEDVVFHEERLLVDRNSHPQLLFLMSLDRVRSRWAEAEQDDYASLRQSLAEQNGWEALYYSKRISQINARDQDVTRTLELVTGILKSGTPGNRSFLESLRANELTEMLKLGHLVERGPGEVICRVGDPGESMFVILRGEVGVYNLEGKGYGGTAKPKHVQRAGEVVGELATALKRPRTADLVAISDVALLSFISEEIKHKLAGTDAGKDAARQYELFITDRVLQHTIQAAPYLLGPSRLGPLSVAPTHSTSRVGAQEAWEATVRDLLPHTELVEVAAEGFTLDVGQVAREVSKDRPRHGLFILVSGTVMAPTAARLSGAQCPLLWVDVPNLLVQSPHTYRREQEPILVLWIGASGIDRLELQQRVELLRALKDTVGGVPSHFEYDVFLCHSSKDKDVVLDVKERLWNEFGIRSWYDDVELTPSVSTRRTIENGLRTSRFFLVCASANVNASAWANREIDSVISSDVKRQGNGPTVLVLKLYEEESNDEAIPLIFRGSKRLNLRRAGDFEKLAHHILSAKGAGNG